MSEEEKLGKRLGLWMLIIGWVGLLGFLGVFFHRWLEGEHNPNAEVLGRVGHGGVKEIILQSNRQHHYVLGGKINGVSVKFMIDTGATMVSIPERLAARLQLQAGRAYPVSTANGTVTVYATLIETLSLGPIVLHRVRAHINPGMKNDDVLLGMSALKTLEFTHKDGVLLIRQK